MTAPTTQVSAETRPACTTTRHTGADYANGGCHCMIGRRRRYRYLKLHRAGLLPPHLQDATGSRRRIEGLRAQGYSLSAIAAAMGVNHANTVHRITRSEHVTAALAAAVQRAAVILGPVPGPSLTARRMAAKQGLVPLWMWDDDTIDDPAAVPVPEAPEPVRVDEVAILRALHAARADLPPTPLTDAELAIVVPKLAGAPTFFTDKRIADRLRIGELRAAKLRGAAGVTRSTQAQQAAAA